MSYKRPEQTKFSEVVSVLSGAGFLICIVLAALTQGCISTDGGLTPVPVAIRQVSTLEGEGVIGSLEVGGMPFTFPIKWWGNGTLTLQYPTQPYVWVDGDLGWIVEPITPQHRSAVEAAVARGDLRLTVRGSPVRLSPSGTVAAMSGVDR